MSSSVACLDFNLCNTSPLRKKNIKTNDNIDKGGWSFLQSLTNSSQINNNNNNNKSIENEKGYVHPLQTRPSSSSSSKLSIKSLEMCTESLGSETGSECGEEIHFTSSLEKLDKSSQPNYQKNWVTEKRKMRRSASFPPPLTSITGVQLRPHREDGRLVLKAENVSSCLTYFQAERSGGRLRLRLLHNCSPNSKSNSNPDEEEEEEEEEDEEEKDDDDDDVRETEETEENVSAKVRGEMGVKKVSTTSRCKEGGGEHGRKDLLNLKPFCVAS